MSETESRDASQQGRSQAMEEAENRGRFIELRQKLYGAVTRQMLEVASLKPGDHVLDIAAGTGDQSRQAAQLVGPEGSVLATDISQEMLTVAARLAEEERLSNVTIRVLNAEQLDLPENTYDVAISRLGLMLIPNQHRALLEIRRVLKPGGRLSALVWSKPECNPLFAPYVTLVNTSWEEEHPGEKASDPFSLADTAHFARVLAEAGFQKVQMQVIPLTFHFPPLTCSSPGGELHSRRPWKSLIQRQDGACRRKYNKSCDHLRDLRGSWDPQNWCWAQP